MSENFTEGDVAFACMSVLVDTLADAGLAGVCISPGSRSTPLALAFARGRRVPAWVHLDERAASFFALGRARAANAPIAIVCTSGTAAAEYLPAVVEASMSCVPLIVLTADRPRELRGTGANQTIDQPGIYGSYVRLAVDAAEPARDEAAARYWRALATRAIDAATGPRPGPVHLNLPFREPLVPSVGVGSEPIFGSSPRPRRSSLVVRAPELPSEHSLQVLAGVIAAHERGVVVAGELSSGGEDVARLASHIGWPLLAEPLSNARIPGHALAAGQALLADERFPATHAPEVVLQFGGPPTTRATQAFVASAARLIVVETNGRPADPGRRAGTIVHADAGALAAALRARLPACGVSQWLSSWRETDAIARDAIDAAMDAIGEPSEGRVARDVAAAIPDGSTLVVASSMPVRDLDHAMRPRAGLRVVGNRGASGIDGFVSTVLGVASSGVPTFALTGDLSLLHDAGGLLWSARRGIAATFVVLNNRGGGIFDLLAQSSLPELDELFATPHDVDLRALAEAAGASYVRVANADDVVSAVLGAQVGGPPRVAIVEVPVDRARAVEYRAAIKEAARAALPA